MATFTYGTSIDPSHYIETPDPDNPGQVIRPAAGLSIRVRDAKTAAAQPSVTSLTYGYIPRFTLTDVSSIEVSADNGGTWVGPLTAAETLDQALIGVSGYARAKQFGVKLDGTTDDRPALQALVNTCIDQGLPGIFLDPGTLRLGTATGSGGTAAGVDMRGVPLVGAGSDLTFVKADGITANCIEYRTKLSASVIATITADVTAGTTAYTVDTSAGFTVGDNVAMRLAQNALDSAEARQTVIGTVTAIPDSTHITVDTPSEWTFTVAGTSAIHRQIFKVTELVENTTIRGITFMGDAGTRHAIGIFWARNVQLQDIAGRDVGSGLINCQWTENLSVRDARVHKCGAFGNANKGRMFSFSNVRTAVVENAQADYFEGAAVYIESYSSGILFTGLQLKNRATTRAQPYLMFTGQECDTFVRGLTVSGKLTDSVTSYATGSGLAHFQDTTIQGPITSLRSFPLTTASGFLRIFDANGVMRTFNLTKIERSTVRIDLAVGSQVKWLRDGLHVAYESYVSPGVTTGMLTSLVIGRTSQGSQPLTWTAGTMQRSSTYIGGGLYPMASAWNQGTKVTTTVPTGAALPTGAFVLVTLLSVAPEGYGTVAAEPGSEQSDRFGAGVATGTSGGGGSSTVTYDGLPAGVVVVVKKSGSTWPNRPSTRTDLIIDWDGAGTDPDPATPPAVNGMYAGDRRTI